MKTRRAKFLQKIARNFNSMCKNEQQLIFNKALPLGHYCGPNEKQILQTQKNKTSKVMHVANKVINDGKKFSVSSFRQVDLIASKLFVRIHIVRDKIVLPLIFQSGENQRENSIKNEIFTSKN